MEEQHNTRQAGQSTPQTQQPWWRTQTSGNHQNRAGQMQHAVSAPGQTSSYGNIANRTGRFQEQARGGDPISRNRPADTSQWRNNQANYRVRSLEVEEPQSENIEENTSPLDSGNEDMPRL